MKRTLLAILAGLITWMIAASAFNHGLRLVIPHYSDVEPTRQFTLAMKIARLAIALASSFLTGIVTFLTAPASRWSPTIVAGILLAMFIPLHISIWPQYPIWYHLFFLTTIIPAVLAGARFAVPLRSVN